MKDIVWSAPNTGSDPYVRVGLKGGAYAELVYRGQVTAAISKGLKVTSTVRPSRDSRARVCFSRTALPFSLEEGESDRFVMPALLAFDSDDTPTDQTPLLRGGPLPCPGTLSA